jgi:hypothetical protein
MSMQAWGIVSSALDRSLAVVMTTLLGLFLGVASGFYIVVSSEPNLTKICITPERCGHLKAVHSRKPNIEKENVRPVGLGDGFNEIEVTSGPTAR